MRMRHWIAVFASATFALTSCAAFGQGNGHGKGNGKDKDKDDDRASERVKFRRHGRDSMDGPLASTENCADERPGEANSHRLLGPDISVKDARGVLIETNDDTARVYPGCIRESDGSRGVERRENALAQQKRMCDACSIVVFPYDIALGVTPSSKRKHSARKINRGECPMVE